MIIHIVATHTNPKSLAPQKNACASQARPLSHSTNQPTLTPDQHVTNTQLSLNRRRSESISPANDSPTSPRSYQARATCDQTHKGAIYRRTTLRRHFVVCVESWLHLGGRIAAFQALLWHARVRLRAAPLRPNTSTRASDQGPKRAAQGRLTLAIGAIGKTPRR